MHIDSLYLTTHSREDVLQLISESTAGSTTITVVTPNLYHLYLARENPRVRAAIESTDISIPDGWPIAHLMSKQLGKPFERITGSDLAISILEIANRKKKSLSILGGNDDSLRQALSSIRRDFPEIRLLPLAENPRLPVLPTRESEQLLVNLLNSKPADIVFFCAGAPKSEMHLAATRTQLLSGSVLCLGATVDFISGAKRRAPVAFQRLKLEWLFRLCQEPRRLFLRYLHSGLAFLAVSSSMR